MGTYDGTSLSVEANSQYFMLRRKRIEGSPATVCLVLDGEDGHLVAKSEFVGNGGAGLLQTVTFTLSQKVEEIRVTALSIDAAGNTSEFSGPLPPDVVEEGCGAQECTIVLPAIQK